MDGGGIRLDFSLAQWCLWQSWEAPRAEPWPLGEVLPCAGGADVGFLPMMQRRRLSPLARAAVAVAWRCRAGQEDMPTVFCSRHGESRHYFDMLGDLACGAEISPSRFSLSVHNAIAGLDSLLSASFAPYSALAGGEEGMFAGFLEAYGLLAEGGSPQVLLVCYEQPLPDAYRAYTHSPEGIWALALRLGRADGFPRLAREASAFDTLTLSLLRRVKGTEAARPADAADTALPQAILAGLRQGECRLERAVWRWSLDHA